MAALARIRIVTHPPLPVIKAWLPFSPDSNLVTLQHHILELLPGISDVQVELEGFTLLPNSPCSILDPSKDVLDVKQISVSSIATPFKAADTTPSAIPLAPVERTRAGSSSRSSSISSSTSSDNSAIPPEQLITKRPTSAAALSQSTRPTKRPKIASDVSMRNDAKDSSDSDSSSSVSSTSSSSSSSSSSTSSSSSESSSGANPSESKTAAAVRSAPTVPPGQGLKRTAKRNQRRRVLKAAREAAQLAATRVAAEPDALTSTIAIKNPAVTSVVSRKSPVVPEAITTRPAAPIANESIPNSSPPKQSPAATKSSKALPLDPYYDIYGPKLDMLHLAAGNKNKKKSIQLNKVAGSNAETPAKKIYFGNDQAGNEHNVESHTTDWQQKQAPFTTQSASPQITKSSKRANGPAQETSQSQTSTSYRMVSPDLSGTPQSGTAAPNSVGNASTLPEPKTSTLAPSQRRDLPPHIQVTWVDVEEPGWQAGLGTIAKGTSVNYAGNPAMRPSSTADTMAPSATAQSRNTKESSWPSIAEVEHSLASGTLPLVDAQTSKAGQLVATRVLELDPVTFAPCLALKYGKLVKPVTLAGQVTIKLHGDCVPATKDESWDWHGDVLDEGDYARRPRIKFGQSIVPEDGGSEINDTWEGECTDLRLVR